MHCPDKISARSGNDSAARPRKTETPLRLFVVQLLCFTLFFQSTGIAYALPSRPAEPTLVSLEPTADLPEGEVNSSQVDRVWDRSRELVSNAWVPLTAWIDSSRQIIQQGFDQAFSVAAPASRPEPVRVASLAPTLALLGVPVAVQSGDIQAGSVRPPTPPRRPTRSQPAVASVGAVPLKATGSDVSLLTGFNLVSIPDEPANTDPTTVLAGINGQLTTAFAYDACDAADPWKLYDPADPAASDLTAIDHTQGLWLDVTSPAVLPVIGTQPATTQIQLCTGWNLIGYPLAQARPVAAALASIEGQYVRVFGFDLGDTADPWEVYDVTVPSWANDLQLMQRGRGYWVLVTEDTTLDYENVGAPPVVEITTPADLSEVTAPTGVIGTVESNSLDYWTLSYRPSGEPGAAFVEVGTGNLPGTGLTLGSFDPTLLLNGMYDLKLEAVDFAGQVVEHVISVVVEGRRKIGNFTLSFIDLEIPLAGLDIKVLRTYDSRDKLPKAFGVGWTLEIFQGSYRNNRTPGEGWQILPDLLPCRTIQETQSHLTAIRLADDEIYRFRLGLSNPATVLGGCFAEARFDFVEGPLRGATLEILGNSDVIYTNGSDRVIDANTLEPYEPTDVRLTTGDGRIFDLDLVTGVTRVEDLNGNTLDVTSTGITHSGGEGIALDRDTAGRVSRITDPAGQTLDYTYDPRGDLIAVEDQVGGVTRFGYDDTHLLLDIEDPRGVKAVRNEYDASGRLIAVVDGNGNRTEFGHDLDARREILTDRRGNVTISVYDEAGNVTSLTDAAGGTKTFTYDARGNKLSETSATGETATFTYDADGNALTDTNETGATRSYTYNTLGQALTLTDPGGATTTSAYDARGNLLASTDPLGGVQSQQYDSRGDLTSTTDALGNTRTSVYDGSGRLLEETDPLGVTATYTYDSNGNQLTRSSSRTEASGSVVTLTETSVYDARNRKIRDIDPLGGVEETEYGPAGRVVAKVDKNGNRIAFTYDVQGHRIRTDYPDATFETATYDAEGNRITTTDRLGRLTAFTYDALNHLVTTTFAGGGSERREYDAAGHLTALVDERGHRTEYEYDGSGQRTRTIDALGNETATVYDSDGNVVSITDAKGQITTFDVDANGRQIRQEFADGTSVSFAYDARGRKTAETNQEGATTGFEYDALARLTAVIDPLGGRTEYLYDEVGNVVSQTDAKGHETTWDYNSGGRVIRKTVPSGASEFLTYDAQGNLLTHADFNGNTVTFTYDADHRLIRKLLPDGSDVVVTYAPTGTPLSVQDSRGTTTYTYDDRDRLLSVANPDGSTLAYHYDAAGNRTSLQAPSGTTQFAFDALNRLTSVTDPAARVTTYSYDAVGNLNATQLANGTRSSYTYDALNRLTLLDNLRDDGTTISSYAYDLLPTGQRARVTEAGGRAVDYTYNVAGRLVSEAIVDPAVGTETISYTYDAVGNRLTKTDNTETTTYTYDVRDRLLTAGSVLYTYDANGNLTSQNDGGQVTAYTFDVENRLVAAQTGSDNISYQYDADGDRVASTVNGALTRFVVDKNRDFAQVLEERDGSGGLEASYVHGLDLISQTRGTAFHVYHYDGLGSTRVLTNELAAITDTYVYDAFGEPLDRTGATINDYQFTGEAVDANLGIYYLRARFYDPGTGRFLSVDPAQGDRFDPITLHRYLYANLDPVNLIDPSGRTAIPIPAPIPLPVVALNPLAILAALAIVGIGYLIYRHLRKKPIRLNHYTRWETLPFILALGSSGGINSPRGENFFTPNVFFSGTTAKSLLALQNKPSVGIRLTLFLVGDGLVGPSVVLDMFDEPGGGIEFVTKQRIPFYTRNPRLWPLLP